MLFEDFAEATVVGANAITSSDTTRWRGSGGGNDPEGDVDGKFVGMYLVTGLGITVGYHRLFTHRSFETYRLVQFVLAALGSMAVQGPLLRWVAMHRRHHAWSSRSRVM